MALTDVSVEIETDDVPASSKPAPAPDPGLSMHGGSSQTGVAPAETALSGVKNIIGVAGGKGGVGKSTISANLAMALKARGARVGLCDIDIYGPSIPIQMGVAEAEARRF